MQVCEYKNPENFGNKNNNYEESEIDKGIDFTSYIGFNIKAESLRILGLSASVLMMLFFFP